MASEYGYERGEHVMIDEAEESKYRMFSPKLPNYNKVHQFIETDGDRAHVEELDADGKPVIGWIVKYEALRKIV